MSRSSHRNEFHIGDRVAIRDWDDMVAEFGLNRYGSIKCDLTFLGSMRYLCGKEYTITDMNPRSVVLDDCDNLDSYGISYDMIRHVEDCATYEPIDEAAFSSLLLEF